MARTEWLYQLETGAISTIGTVVQQDFEGLIGSWLPVLYLHT